MEIYNNSLKVTAVTTDREWGCCQVKLSLDIMGKPSSHPHLEGVPKFRLSAKHRLTESHPITA